MKKQKIKKLGKEEGFFSAFVLVFLVTLGLMGIGASILVQSESKNVTHHINSVKSDYLMEGAAFYATAALSTGTLMSDTSFTVENIDVDVDTSYDDDQLVMDVTASVEDYERTIRFELVQHPLWQKAIYVHGDVTNAYAKDSDGHVDNSLIVANQNPMPQVATSTLNSMAASQVHEQNNGWVATDNYPGTGSFYFSGNTPNVTHVYGNMSVGNVTIYGIYVVDGNVTLTNKRADIRGVIYLVNPETTLTAQNSYATRTELQGGIFGFGSVTASGRSLYVRHNPEYMRVFSNYVGPIPGGTKIADWSY